jgi:hypothetical protein
LNYIRSPTAPFAGQLLWDRTSIIWFVDRVGAEPSLVMSQLNLNHFYVSEPFQTFYRWLKDNSKSSGCPGDSPFLPHDLLSDHLESNGYEVLNTLLGAIYQGQNVPISAKGVVSAYSNIFCILICIGKPESLPVFMSCDDLNDQHLPFKLYDRPSQFPFDPTAPEFFEDFCQEQWRFCPPTIDANCNRRFEKNYVLPFTKKTQIAEGANATISTIEIYPWYNALPSLAVSSYTKAHWPLSIHCLIQG